MRDGTKKKSQAGSVKKATARKKAVGAQKARAASGKGKKVAARKQAVEKVAAKAKAVKNPKNGGTSKGSGAPKESNARKTVAKEPAYTFASAELDVAFRRVAGRYSTALKRLAD